MTSFFIRLGHAGTEVVATILSDLLIVTVKEKCKKKEEKEWQETIIIKNL